MSDRLRDFEERAVNAACIFSLLKQRADRVPESEMRVKVSDIEKMFHRAIQGKDIKRRIRQKILLPVRPPGPTRQATRDPRRPAQLPPRQPRRRRYLRHRRL